MAYAQVILREKIPGLGVEADVVKVRAGYARNFLFPQHKAFEATKTNLRHVEKLKEARAKREAEELVEAQKVSGKIKKLKLKLKLATGASGKAFGSITTSDIAKAITAETGFAIDRHQIELAKPIKATGKHDVTIKLHNEITIELKIDVSSEGAKEQPEAADDEGSNEE